MTRFDHAKYRPNPVIALRDRTWPDRVLTKAPDWCSVDLRDGNQALVRPMSVDLKLRLFNLLVKLGFKEIEIGFPAASQTEYAFARRLIEDNMIPDDVTVQVLTQARRELIERTFESLHGVRSAIVHVYNSTSTVQREQVFRAGESQIRQIAIDGASWVRELAARHRDTTWSFQYSPESFTGTEPDYAIDVCNAVIGVWQPAAGQRVIINLPATVEVTGPNVFADQIEYVCRRIAAREYIRISLHTHNDRGCAVAAAELGLLAGADRVEGTLFGNGERTGNMDIVTLAMNLYSQGIDPRLDLANMATIVSEYEACTGMTVPPRQPWVGELVYTAFSGSHQDAIRKSIAYHEEHRLPTWNVAYLPIDPRDLGRHYQEVVRINSQSGKGGVALILERDYGIHVPKWLHPELGRAVQRVAEECGGEVPSLQVRAVFETEFLAVPEGWALQGYALSSEAGQTHARFSLGGTGQGQTELHGNGHGLIEALTDGLARAFGVRINIEAYDEHALSPGTEAQALASVGLRVDGVAGHACAIDEDSTQATLQAVLSAVGRVLAARGEVAQARRQA
ncbi:MAG: 2-isopropylmalate synthase [Gammaproteobacteria bacterium]|nr:2-isopropylmalate synthase [Gammaproteobacteria bacterium]